MRGPTAENIVGNQPGENGSEKADRTEQQTGKRSKMVGFLITRRDAIVAFLDRHNASVSAVATAFSAFGTIAIVGLTCFYVGYSKKQWETMQQQLHDAEAVSGAILSVEMPTPQITESQGGIFANGKIVVRDVGGTTAIHTSIKYWLGGGVQRPGWPMQKPIVIPNPEGPPIPVSTPVEIPYSQFIGEKDDLFSEKMYSSFLIEVAYDDLFKTSHTLSVCFLYVPQAAGFYPVCGRTETVRPGEQK